MYLRMKYRTNVTGAVDRPINVRFDDQFGSGLAIAGICQLVDIDML